MSVATRVEERPATDDILLDGRLYSGVPLGAAIYEARLELPLDEPESRELSALRQLADHLRALPAAHRFAWRGDRIGADSALALGVLLRDSRHATCRAIGHNLILLSDRGAITHHIDEAWVVVPAEPRWDHIDRVNIVAWR